MIFKPRIFISSTISENLRIRAEIEEFFSCVGAETMLYERNLTPSVNAMTYRRDILDADFIIFIIKYNYGVKTDQGISGTHEEFQIALDTQIPKHVYIKLGKTQRNTKKLIDEISGNNISFYYYHDDAQLLQRIKETTFTIAKEIMLKKLESTQLPKTSIKKLSVNYDYKRALDIIMIIDALNYISRDWGFDFIDSTIFDAFIEPIAMERSHQKWMFIDRKLEDILDEMLSIYQRFSNHGIDFTSTRTHRTVNVPVLGQVTVSNCSLTNSSPTMSRDGYRNIIDEFFRIYDEFKQYVERMRVFSDSL